MKQAILSLMAIFIAAATMAEAPETTLRPQLRPESVVQRLIEADEINCLALNVYHESRGEHLEGQIAVAQVTMNRMEHEYFPNTVCDVVWQSKQFSWTHDGRSDHPHERLAWITALDIADLVYRGQVEDPTKGALFYHATWVRPVWRHRMDYFDTIGIHKFYHWDGNWNND